MKSFKRLPDSELEVMLIIWQSGEMIPTGEILQKLSGSRKCNLQMVQSSLNRLLDKCFVQCDKIGRLNYYQPLVAEEEYREQETNSFIEKMYASSPAKLVATLIRSHSVSEEEIAEIRRILEKGGE